MYPITISDVISAIEKGTLTSDEHVEICGIPRNYSLLVRKMVSLANSGGGVAVLGLALDKVHKTWVKRITPINTRELKIRITEEIIGRVKNMGDWRIDSGDCRGSVVSAIFVAPSSKGMSYIYSSSDPLNRSYVYRDKDSIKTIRHQYTKLYKYMTVDAFITSLETESLRFWEPHRWPDKFESRFYRAIYTIPYAPEDIQRVYATCMTNTMNSEAAWKVYVGKDGLKEHCIQIELNTNEYLNQLFASGYKIYDRKVTYMDEYHLLKIHLPGSPGYGSFFRDFSFNKFLNLLSLKRDAYKYENEIRFFAVNQKYVPCTPDEEATAADLHMEWSRVIKSIRIDKNCSDAELIALRYSCASKGIDLHIKDKILPGKVTLSPGALVVEAVLFNIDDMPGSPRITIKP